MTAEEMLSYYVANTKTTFIDGGNIVDLGDLVRLYANKRIVEEMEYLDNNWASFQLQGRLRSRINILKED